MKLTDALDKLRAEQPRMAPCEPGTGCPPKCCGEDVNVAAGRIAGERVLAQLGPEWADFDTFDNCREYGLTFTVPGWQFAIYEHRNSDELCLQGCPAALVQPYGPYGGTRDKYDVLARAEYGEFDAIAAALVAALRHVNLGPQVSRRELKSVIRERTEL